MTTTKTQYLAAITTFISRFGFLPANFSPLGGFGFFSKNPILFAATIIGFDLIKGGFYKGFIWTYLGFATYYVLGRLAKESTKRQFALLPLASLLFFIFSNIGVWWFWFPQTLEGLIACFTAALPFYKNTFLGDVIFGYGFLAAQTLVRRYSVRNQVQPVLATSA